MVRVKFGEWLKTTLIKHNMSRTELAKALAVGQSTVTGWINGRMMPRLDKALMLCDIFGLPYTELERFGYDIPRMLMSAESVVVSPQHEAYPLISYIYNNPKVAEHLEAIMRSALGMYDEQHTTQKLPEPSKNRSQAKRNSQ